MPAYGETAGGAVQGGFAFAADITPSQITSNQNDYAPTGYATAVVYRLDLDAARTITGFAGGADGQFKIIHNTSAYVLTLANASGSSSAANRLDVASDVIVGPKTSVALFYDSTASRWKILARPVIGLKPIWIPATAMTPRTTNGSAAAASVETSTNKVMLKTLDFDASTKEYAQFNFPAIKGWDKGTIYARFFWKHASTSTNFGVTWGLQAVALSDDDAGDTAFGTAQESSDTGGTTSDIYVSPLTAAITVAGTPLSLDLVFAQLYRDPANASDTMAIDAGLLGVEVLINITAPTED